MTEYQLHHVTAGELTSRLEVAKKKCMPVWYLIHFISFTSLFPYFLPLFHFLLSTYLFHSCVSSSSWCFLPDSDPDSESGQRAVTVGQFLLHCELKSMLAVIVLLHKFLDHDACVILRHTGTVFL